MRAKNIDIVRHIESYCRDIENTVKRFGEYFHIVGVLPENDRTL